MRGRGKNNKEIAEKLDTSPKVVSRWVSAYKKGGIEALFNKRKGGNHRNLSYEEEAEILAQFTEKSENGHIVEVSEIRKAYEEAVGHKTAFTHIYSILKRHNWTKKMPRSRHPKKADNETIEASKKIKSFVKEKEQVFNNSTVRLMFQDEAGFGRINKPKSCWCEKKIRPTVPCHHIREYRYTYGAVEPKTGEGYFLIMPYCNTDCMNVFLEHLSTSYPNDIIILVCDGAVWHKSKRLKIPDNIFLTFIPPYTPEMNPIEQIWREIRTQGFQNEVFATLDKVVDRLCNTICSLTAETIKSITGRDWILSTC